jgi:nucleotide-binding universal stress UspA family protein
MTYATVMVHLELGHSNAPILQLASRFAKHFHANLIGIAGSQMMAASYGDSYVSAEVLVQIRDEAARECIEAEKEFRDALRAKGDSLEWRSTLMCPSLPEYIAKEARSADLILTAVAMPDLLDTARLADTGELILQIGRPVLCIPGTADKLNFDNVVVAWKETREARRAALDALPLLKAAKQVTVVELVEEGERAGARSRVNSVGHWLKQHGVVAECRALRSTGDEAPQLSAIAHKQGAGVIVAGAYGHSRLREFVFGGVTQQLLHSTECCSFLSH